MKRLLITLILLITFSCLYATTRYISKTNSLDDGQCTDVSSPCATFQYTISQAQSGDTIEIFEGTYDLGGSTVNVDKSLIFQPYQGSVVEIQNNDASSVFTITSGGIEIKLKGFSVKNVETAVTVIQDGVKIILQNMNFNKTQIYAKGNEILLNIEKCYFFGSYCLLIGENPFSNPSSAIIRNSHFLDNSRIIIAYAFNVTIQNTALIHNDVEDMDGVLCILYCSGRIEISNLTSIENVGYYGAAIYIYTEYASSEQIILIEKSTFIDNMAQYGAAVFLNSLSGSISISECNFFRNVAYEQGAGVFAIDITGTLEISRSMFAYSTANFGGGISVDTSNFVVRNCTFKENRVGTAGGGIWSYKCSNGVIDGCLFERNKALFEDTIGCGVTAISSGSLSLFDSNFIENNCFGENVIGGGLLFDGIEISLHGCEFLNNFVGSTGGGCYIIATHFKSTRTRWILNKSNYFSGGIAVYSEGRGNVEISDSEFNGNFAENDGGSSFYDFGDVVLKNITYSGNTANMIGGLRLSGCTNATLDSLLIENNRAEDQIAIGFISDAERIYLKNSIIRNNFAQGDYGGFYVSDVMNMNTRVLGSGGFFSENNIFEENYAQGISSVFAAYNNFLLDFVNTTFKKNYAASGGALYLDGYSIVEETECIDKGCYTIFVGGTRFDRCEFIGNTVLLNEYGFGYGGAIYIGSTKVYVNIQNSIFTENKARYGGAIYSISHNLEINFQNNSASVGGCLFCLMSRAYAESSSFVNCTASDKGGAITADFSALYLNNSVISNSFAAESGGALHCTDLSSCFLIDTFASENKAKRGGSLSVESAKLEINNTKNTIIQRSTALENGGGIDIRSSSTAYLSKLMLIENSAQFGAGISVCQSSKLYFDDIVSLYGNHASIGGGGFYCFSTDCVNPDLIMSVNQTSDGYGDFIATDPKGIVFESISTNSANNGSIILFPNQEFDITVRVFDESGATVKYYPSLIVSVGAIKPSKIFGESFSETSNSGFFTFRKLSANGPINSTIQIEFTSDQISLPTYSYKINISLIQCDRGYQQHEEIENGVSIAYCKKCPDGYYSITRGSPSCKKCPLFATCTDGGVSAAKNYWLIENYQTGIAEIHNCPNGKCLGNNRCSDDRDTTFPLCSACKPGYSEWNGECIKCDKPNYLFLVLYVFYIGAMYLMNHITSQSPDSAANKILFFFGQTLLLIVGSSEWIAWMSILFNFQLSGSETKTSDSSLIKCPFPKDSWLSLLLEVLYPLALYVFLVITILVALCIKLSLILSAKKTKKTRVITQNETKFKKIMKTAKNKIKEKLSELFLNKDAYILSFTNLLIITFQSFMSASLAFFTCKLFAGEWRLVLSTNIQCFTPKYFAWFPLYLIILIYVIVGPFILLIFMIISHKTKLMKKPWFEKYFAAFYKSYREQCYWYEFLYVIRKTIITGIIVLNNYMEWSYGELYLILATIFCAYFLLQRYIAPYNTPLENRLEEISLLMLTLISLIRASFAYYGVVDFAMFLIFAFTIPTLALLGFYVLLNSIIKDITIALLKKTKCGRSLLRYIELRIKKFQNKSKYKVYSTEVNMKDENEKCGNTPSNEIELKSISRKISDVTDTNHAD